MKIAVIGAGAVGGYFGGRLAQAGLDVRFVARGATLEALRSEGLRVRSVAGDFTIAEPRVAASPAEVGVVDTVLVAVKAPQVAEVAPALAPLVGPRTLVVPLQNGLEAPGTLAAALSADRVVGGLCKIFASRTAPGEIEHVGLEPTIELGELDGRRSERVERVCSTFAAAQGMQTVSPDDIRVAMWQKLLYVEPLGLVGAASRMPAGKIRAVPRTRRLMQTAMEEIVAVARARGVALDRALPAQAIGRLDKLPASATASMQRDILGGRPSELDLQAGTVVRFAAESGVEVPVHQALYAALLPAEMLARGALRQE